MRNTLAISILLFSLIKITAQQPIIKVDSTRYLIGDWIDLTAEISLEDFNGNAFIWPPIIDKWDKFEVLDISPIDTLVKEKTILKQHYRLITFDTGHFELSPLNFVLVSGDTIKSNPLIIQIQGVDIDTTSLDPKPIKAPFKAPFKIKEILPHLLIGLLVVLFFALLIWFLTRKKPTEKTIKIEKEITQPPHEWAIQALQALQKQNLWQEGLVKAYYSELTEIIKTYIELRFKTAALESTSDEVINSLLKLVNPKTTIEQLSYLLKTADLAKFAKSKPLASDNEKCMQIAYEFIDLTKIEEKTEEDV